MKKLIMSCVLLIAGLQLVAQTNSKETKVELPPVVFKGKLTFERKMNMHKQMEGFMKDRPEMASMMENLKKQIPKYRTDIFELNFTDKHSLYKPAPNGLMEIKGMMGSFPADKNNIYNDYEKQECIAEKDVFDKVYLLNDSFKHFNWKITEEFRKVAGFNCRRAETVILDSVYVIAFYTDQILAEGGPEGFTGLPGMILGIVMPRLNMTYFATNYENYVADEKDIAPPTKGTKKKASELESDLKENTKQWGEFANRLLWYLNI